MMGYLDNYVPVAERLHQALSQIQVISTEPPVLINEVMGYIRTTVVLKDGRTATGTASFRLDLSGKSAQATNPIEDCETSAIGRALAFLGYESSWSISSREEVAEAQRRANGTPPACQVCGKPSRPGKSFCSRECFESFQKEAA